ncbi:MULTISPECIES: hypothetical protein [unclassified Fusibacter]|uniref:hypothetical protein n=1 Tax=unclassified Fusibacter TaxID=2624464 RepID=UPI001012D9E8|nr:MULTISPECIES: hypothetical protein [unclassified Fusibacter]MCK8059789.1 hypothetical protein [Fusibacter sp. A2]NPE21590.1 hypothetical protein [Fusibacter sp. A1]RXV61997.1 hypothetical protein DWB64_07090 [Fusibacter sp. A1]
MRINRDLMQAAKQLYNDLKSPEANAVGATTIKENGTPTNESPDLSGLTKETQDGVKLLTSLGVEATPETIDAVNKFMTEAPGTTAEKLMAISMIVDKGMPLSPMLMSDIHNSRTVSLVDFIAPQKAPVRAGQKQEEALADTGSAKNAVLSVVTSLDGLLLDLLEALSTDNPQVVDSAVDNTFDQASYEQAKTDLLGVTEKASDDENRSLQHEPKGHGEHSIGHQGKDFLDEDHLVELLEQLTEAVKEMPVDEVQALASMMVEALPQQVRMVLEETVTPKLAQVRNEFNTFRKEINRQLNDIVSKEIPMPKEHKVQLLDKLIDKLDQAVMKSEIGLYISLKGERDLLKQSAVLSEAKTHLMKGDIVKAEDLVKQVVKAIDEMTFKPTLKKAVVVMPLVQSKLQDGIGYEDIKEWGRDMVEEFSNSEKSPAVLTHYLRRMGVNHEAEVFQKVFGSEGNKASETMPSKPLENLKSMLMSLAKTGATSAEQETVAKTLSHINGQQLNMKVTDKPQPQQLMINIPMSLEGHLTDVKVFIKSKQKDMKVDWENFNMFFVLDTKAFGDVGIKVASIDKKVKVEVLNNNTNAEAAIKPLTEMLKNYVEDVGFSVTGINFNSWGNEHPTKTNPPKEVAKPEPFLRENRGFDFKV